MIINVATAADHPWRAHGTAMCWTCGHDLGARQYVALGGAPFVLWLHARCVLPTAWQLIREWRQAVLLSEFEIADG